MALGLTVNHARRLEPPFLPIADVDRPLPHAGHLRQSAGGIADYAVNVQQAGQVAQLPERSVDTRVRMRSHERRDHLPEHATADIRIGHREYQIRLAETLE